MRAKSVPVPKEEFYGYSADLIAEWCLVDLKTAHHYKSGARKPCPRAWELFCLNRDGRIVPGEWQGYRFRRNKLFDPWDKELDHRQLRAWPWAMQLLQEFARITGRQRDVEMLYGAARTILAPPTAAERSPSPPQAGCEPSAAHEAPKAPSAPPRLPQSKQTRPVLPRRLAAVAKPDPFASLSPELRPVANRLAAGSRR